MKPLTTFLTAIMLVLLLKPATAQEFFEHTVTENNRNGHVTTLSNPSLNNQANALVFVSQLYGKYNANEVGVWYNGGKWKIFNQNKKELPIGTKFFVYVPPKNFENAFVVTTSSGNTNNHITTIERSISKDDLLFITQRFGKYNTSPVGIYRAGNQWKIFNENRSEMPINTKFNVLVLKKGANKIGNNSVFAGIHSNQQTASHISTITPKLNNKKSKLMVSNHWVGTYNQNSIGVWHNGNDWTVFNQNLQKMPKGFQVNYFVEKNNLAIPNPGPVVTIPNQDIPLPQLPENVELFKKTVTLPLHTSPMEITYFLDDDGYAIYEGDIVLGEGHDFTIEEPEPYPTPRSFSEFGTIGASKYGVSTAALVSRRSDGFINRNWLWPNGVIPYNIREWRFTDAEIALIHEGINELNERTNLNIVPTGALLEKNIEFVKRDIMEAPGSSRVGRNRLSRHRVRLKSGFDKRTVIHEILHAAGFWHEQSRRDRDRYVEVRYENIDDSFEYNFDIHDTDAEILTPYDLNSIMHYGGFAFSENGNPTIVNRATGRPVTRARELSDYDIDGINTAYPVDYYGTVSRVPTTLRQVKLLVKQVVSRDLDGPGDENEFYIKTEIGPGFTWRPGNSSNPTRRQASGKKRTRGLETRPNWLHSHLIEPGERYAKVWLLLREDDFLARNERSDDTFNINPFPAMNHVELKIDTFTGQIFLGDIDGVFHEENYIGDIGDDIELEGFEGGFKAYIVFQITLGD